MLTLQILIPPPSTKYVASRCGLLWADTLNVVDGRVTLGFAGVTPVTPASPPVTDRVVPFCFRSPIHESDCACPESLLNFRLQLVLLIGIYTGRPPPLFLVSDLGTTPKTRQ